MQTLVWYTVLKLSQTPNPELIKIEENSDSGPIQREKIGKQYQKISKRICRISKTVRSSVSELDSQSKGCVFESRLTLNTRYCARIVSNFGSVIRKKSLNKRSLHQKKCRLSFDLFDFAQMVLNHHLKFYKGKIIIQSNLCIATSFGSKSNCPPVNNHLNHSSYFIA